MKALNAIERTEQCTGAYIKMALFIDVQSWSNWRAVCAPGPEWV